MSGMIHLISEDRRDVIVVQAILKAKGFKVRVKPHPASHGGISRLAQELEALIQACLRERAAGDCIAVLHDADEHRQPNRGDYNEIKLTCNRYTRDVAHIVAHDELEAWLLADGGLCRWLEIPANNWDDRPKPSDTLDSLLKSKKKLRYQADGRDEVLKHIAGDGDIHSPSMKDALKHLENAPCIRP